ncbi:MAG: TIGR02186 family protein [Candidatus Sulfopaludibacter sp.]|nr:TIGR02186 family protein [Candidatus Sulfopaludibacter sp.]
MSVASLVMLSLYAGGVVPPSLIRSVTPRVIEVGVFYEGANVRVEGVAPPGSKVILTVTGSASAEAFNRKARYGPIWLTAGKVRISGAPSLFLRFSAEPVRNLLSDDCIAGNDLDEAALMNHVHLEPAQKDPALRAALQADYVALKKSDGTYDFAGSRIVMGQPSNEGTPYTLEFRWPKKAPPAEYQIHAFEVRDGQVAREASVAIPVVPTGFPAWLAILSESRASLYGISAVLISALAGFGIDFLTTHLFRGKRVSH